ncbi:hypothetical protein V5799_032170 [Amblyomma americanum]|uniref:Uncharacterized protein n=1 Tax=Amblyomma americanum TaxID=6943 RepID=A0AAQ4DRY2_AMBAM
MFHAGVLLEAQHFGVQCAIPALQKLSKEPIASRPTRVVLSSTGNTRSLTREDVIEALGKMPSAQVRFQVRVLPSIAARYSGVQKTANCIRVWSYCYSWH